MESRSLSSKSPPPELAAVAATELRADEPESPHVHVLVYGSTPGGVAAAVEAARSGVSR